MQMAEEKQKLQTEIAKLSADLHEKTEGLNNLEQEANAERKRLMQKVGLLHLTISAEAFIF